MNARHRHTSPTPSRSPTSPNGSSHSTDRPDRPDSRRPPNPPRRGGCGGGSPSPHPTSNEKQQTKDEKPTVRQTTFSISEEFLRRIYFIKKRHPARFIVIIDRKALQKTVQLWRFISAVYDEVWISDNHSKILLIEHPDGRKASLVTSQNLTRGNRAESAVISSDPAIYAQLHADFEDLRQNNSAPMHELMNIPAGQPPTQADPASESSAARPRAAHIQADPTSTPEADPTISGIERLAGYFVTITEIATVLGLNPTELRDRIADPDTAESLAYRRGKAKAKIELKAKEMELAAVGSPLAMQSVRENLLIMEADED